MLLLFAHYKGSTFLSNTQIFKHLFYQKYKNIFKNTSLMRSFDKYTLLYRKYFPLSEKL